MKKIISLGLVFILILSGCGSGGSSSDVSSDSERVQEAVLDVWAPVGKNSEWIEYATESYNEEYGTNITLNITDVAPSDYPGKVAPTLAAGDELPEISLIQEYDFYQIYSEYEAAYINLDDYGIGDSIRDSINEGKLSIVTNIADGQLLGFPLDVSPALMYYREDLFEEVGIDYESEIETFEDLFAAGEKIYDETGVQMFGISATADTTMFNVFMQSQGYNFTDSEGEIILDSPEGVIAAEALYKLQNSEATSKVVNGDQFAAVTQSSSMTLQGSWWAGSNSRNNPDQAGLWKATSIPGLEASDESYGAVQGGSSLYVGSNSSDAQAALQVLEYAFTNAEVATEMIGFEITPASTLALESDLAKEDNDYYGMSILQLAQSEADRFSDNIYFNFPYKTYTSVIGAELDYYINSDGTDPTAQEALELSTENIKSTLGE